MSKRIAALILALATALALVCPVWAADQPESQEDYIAAEHTKSNGKPYYIMVNRAQNTVTVYALGEDGCYSEPVRAMICSVGREGHATPSGTFAIGGRWPWLHMVDGSYGQYATQISGNILFHSVCYEKKDPSALMTFEYNALGERASLGCVRLQTEDAKWIYDNCARGTKVTVYDGEQPGALGKPGRTVDFITEAMDNGWDPTDPSPQNPWRASPMPADGQEVTYGLVARNLHRMSGASASDAVAWARSCGVLSATGDAGALVTRQELIGMLYRYETQFLDHDVRAIGALSKFDDAAVVWTYNQSAMRWAVGTGLMQGTSPTTLHPNYYATQVQLDIILQRYENLSRSSR